MNRKSKPKTDDILPQEDRFMPTVTKTTTATTATTGRKFSLLPGGFSGSKAKGNPISIPKAPNRHDHPSYKYKSKVPFNRRTGVSIDSLDANLLYHTSPTVSVPKLNNNLKTPDETRQRKIQQKYQPRERSIQLSTTKHDSVSDYRSPALSKSTAWTINDINKDTLDRQITNPIDSSSKPSSPVQHKQQTSTRLYKTKDKDIRAPGGHHSRGIYIGLDDDKDTVDSKNNKSDSDNGDKDEVYYSASSSLEDNDKMDTFILPVKNKRYKRPVARGTPIATPTINHHNQSSSPPPLAPITGNLLTKKKRKTNDDDMTTNTSPAPVELSDEEMCDANDTILFTYPVDRSKGSITISIQDSKRLEPEEFLNDSIIDFYLKWLMDSYNGITGYRHHSERTRQATNNTHIFSSFFYNRLTQGTEQTGYIKYDNVRKWTTKIDLFEKKYAIFPINEKWHWYLVLVCNIDKCIPTETHNGTSMNDVDLRDRPLMFVLDSLGGNQRTSMVNLIRYLFKEAAARRNVKQADFIRPDIYISNVPKQDNTCDCGVFLLHFVDQFLNSPQEFVDILLAKDSRHTKWKEREIKEKRQELKDLFTKVHQLYRSQNSI
ncbi:hypothetical protein BC941DRAFT_418699 [Chlamydoabsidia padenii]|nr:hypothetical protein BC941DRAFT_418699 [Chlamydoabsidia padenii]